MNPIRRSLAILAMAALSTMACTAVARMFGLQSAPPGVLPGEPTPPAILPEEASPAAQATEPRRLQLPSTPTPFHVTSADDPRAVLDLAHPDYIDYFDVPDRWFDYDTPGRAAYRVVDGHLEGTDYEPEQIYTWWSYTEHQGGNSYAEVSATNGDCIDKDALGFVMRSDAKTASGGYGLEVSCDGNWRLLIYRQGKTAEALIPWTASDLIKTGPGAVNRLGFWGYQPHLILFINGMQVGEFTDRNVSYSYGPYALYVRSAMTYDLTGTFDDFAVWEVPTTP
jgi:hypothetical protein